ncbi:hypothetical protein HO133_011039 [Letharia lupina]|uniref:Uncharacterized protein n=1 Tax=Letharia lupina TaxID=560253 RepID=A0A8H6CJ51_9LECA|nr:uncharacterized protein HO133_011039 [Letharia lupina]KAF6224462.1 hypothetical protein HO133_011039 [Letharia lupina]
MDLYSVRGVTHRIDQELSAEEPPGAKYQTARSLRIHHNSYALHVRFGTEDKMAPRLDYQRGSHEARAEPVPLQIRALSIASKPPGWRLAREAHRVHITATCNDRLSHTASRLYPYRRVAHPPFNTIGAACFWIEIPPGSTPPQTEPLPVFPPLPLPSTCNTPARFLLASLPNNPNPLNQILASVTGARSVRCQKAARWVPLVGWVGIKLPISDE